MIPSWDTIAAGAEPGSRTVGPISRTDIVRYQGRWPDEFAMLVFRAPGASPTRLTQPDGSVLEHKKATASLRWQRTSTYDLITVKQPKVGEWQVEASVDAGKRVMIVTDSSLELGALPSAIIPGEPVSIDGQVVLRGLAVDDLRFLNLVEISTLYMVNGMVRHAPPVEARRETDGG